MTTPLPRYSLCLGALRASLVVGAIVDFGLAATLLFGSDWASGTLGVPLPAEPFYIWLLAVLVAMLGAFYLLAAYDPLSYSGNILVAIGGRSAAGLVLLIGAAQASDLGGLRWLAGADLGLALVHWVLWFPTLGRSHT